MWLEQIKSLQKVNVSPKTLRVCRECLCTSGEKLFPVGRNICFDCYKLKTRKQAKEFWHAQSKEYQQLHWEKTR